MRKFKFRVWDIDRNEWASFMDAILLDGSNHLYYLGYEPERNIGNYKIQQFTGFIDSNGQEIFEGDIVHFIGKNCPVYWEEDYGAYWADRNDGFADWLYRELKEVRVIGNIFENGDLLK